MLPFYLINRYCFFSYDQLNRPCICEILPNCKLKCIFCVHFYFFNWNAKNMEKSRHALATGNVRLQKVKLYAHS